MPATRTHEARPFSFWERLKEIDLFFAGNDKVHHTMRRAAKELEDAGIPYALVGGMALNAHRYRRTTDDVDFLLTPDGPREVPRAVRRERLRPELPADPEGSSTARMA